MATTGLYGRGVTVTGGASVIAPGGASDAPEARIPPVLMKCMGNLRCVAAHE
ncbi:MULTISPECIES: hypothetical protein [Streptomyces]|uniref:Uncharacterized protein n=1 Tax=Streptomyces sp. NBC_00093 TaxID=2975649 RepID=A0AAU1ZP11_9ACTN